LLLDEANIESFTLNAPLPAQMPFSGFGGCATADGSAVFLFGGRVVDSLGSSTPSASVFRLDIGIISWKWSLIMLF